MLSHPNRERFDGLTAFANQNCWLDHAVFRLKCRSGAWAQFLRAKFVDWLSHTNGETFEGVCKPKLLTRSCCLSSFVVVQVVLESQIRWRTLTSIFASQNCWAHLSHWKWLSRTANPLDGSTLRSRVHAVHEKRISPRLACHTQVPYCIWKYISAWKTKRWYNHLGQRTINTFGLQYYFWMTLFGLHLRRDNATW